MLDVHELTEKVKRKVLELGFARVGVTTPDPIDGYEDELCRRHGYGIWNVGDPDSKLRLAARPSQKIPEVKSVISLVRAVGNIDYPPRLLEHLGRIYLSRAYLPPDDTLEGKRVLLFEEYLASLGIRSLYDHTNMQLVDRAIAARAGLITYGRNNFAYADDLGSFIVLVTIPVDAELECEVHEPRRVCPQDCHICIDACPTRAMGDDGALDPTRCVLYSNFSPAECKDPAVTALIGQRIHGCDACQVACPRNARALAAGKAADPYLDWLAERFSLEDMLFCDGDYYESCLRPVMFNYIRDIDIFRQNAAIAMGNSGDVSYLPALRRAADEGSDEVRRFARVAIEQLE
ncbi:MAG: epoxyqueuosine reductase [Eggerthellaceae bacterium]|nr:epoxyqueuosine reductase [Eggerthellaceae bacterium]